MNKIVVTPKENTQAARVAEIIKHLDYSVNRFEKELGLSNGVMYNIFKRGSVTKTMLQRIVTRYPFINAHWLLTGEGEMIKKDAPNVITITQGDNNNTAVGRSNITTTKTPAPKESLELVVKHKNEIISQQGKIISSYEEIIKLLREKVSSLEEKVRLYEENNIQ